MTHLPFVLFLCAVLLAPIHAQVGSLTIGDTVKLESTTLKEPRTLFISKPAGYDKGTDQYPVLYLLDAEEHFRYTASIVNFLAASDRIPDMLVVGIASGDLQKRTRDLTPPSTAEIDNRFSPGNGGADNFLSFLSGELIPYVDRHYRTRPYRLLVGHSFGGLFAIYAFTEIPKLFHGYIAADPSLNWNNQAVAEKMESFLSRAGALSEGAFSTDLYLSATDLSGKVPGEIARVKAALDDEAPVGMRWMFAWMPQEGHTSIPLPSIYHGLEMIFEEWRLTDPLTLFDHGGIEAIHRRFIEGGKRFGFPDRSTPPFTVSLLVAALLGAGRLEEASQVLDHDMKNYPPPWNQLEALGRAYEKRGEKQQAVNYYRLSLGRNPNNEFAKAKVAELGIPEQRR